MAGRPAGIPAAIDGVLQLSAASWSGDAGGEATTGRRDSSGSEEAVLCRGERPGELSGHAERVGRPGAECARGAGRRKEKGEGGRKRKRKGKREEEKKKKRGRKKRKGKGGAGGIHDDGREPVAASTRSDTHEKRGE